LDWNEQERQKYDAMKKKSETGIDLILAPKFKLQIQWPPVASSLKIFKVRVAGRDPEAKTFPTIYNMAKKTLPNAISHGTLVKCKLDYI
jgi:hypothetical protein